MKPNSQCTSKGIRTWKFGRIHPVAIVGVIVAPLLVGGVAASGEILGPYVPDESTLHLWHMDEAAVPVVDAVANGLDLAALDNGATLGNESYLGPKGFGTALCTYTGNPNVEPGSAGQDAYLSALPLQNGAGDNVTLSYDGPAGAFTYEAVVRIDFDPTASYGPSGWGQGRSLFMQIICADADEAASRLFQFRLAPVGTLNGNEHPLLEFINLNKGTEIQSLTAPIPTEGPDAILLGNWYHVAVTYDGQAGGNDNLRFYWTLVSPDRTAANLIGSGQMTHSLAQGCRPDFAIGQTGRQSPATPRPNNNFVGLIDEVRMSGVARPADGMLFGTRNFVAKSPVSTEIPLAVAFGLQTSTPEPAFIPTAEKPVNSAKAAPQSVPIVTPVAVTQSVPITTASSTPPASLDTSRIKAGTSIASIAPPTIKDGAVVRGPNDQHRLAILFSCSDSDEGASVIMQSLRLHHAKASFFISRGFLKWPLNIAFARAAFAEGHYVGPASDSWVQFDQAGSPSYSGMEEHLKRLASLGIEWKAERFFLATPNQVNSDLAERGRNLGLIMLGPTPGTLAQATATVAGTKQFVSSRDIVESILACDRRDANGLNGFLLLFPLDFGSRPKDWFFPHFDQLLNDLQKRGYEFVRVDELLNSADTPKLLSLGSAR